MSQDSVQTAPQRPVLPLKGGCACGNIRYVLKTAPLVIHCCHCTSCQRETGTAFAVNAVVEGDEVALIPGATTIQPLVTFPDSALDSWTPKQSRPSGPSRPGSADDTDGAVGLTGDARDDIASPVLLPVPADSGAPQNIARCPVCLTAVWSNYDGLPLLKFLRVGTLDSPSLLGGPDIHIYVRSKQSFFEIPDDGNPRFDTFYPHKEGVWSPEAMVRREKLLIRIAAWFKQKGLEG